MATTDHPKPAAAPQESEPRPVPITVALERVGAPAEGADYEGAFPFLDEAQIAKLRRYGVEETVEPWSCSARASAAPISLWS